MSSPAPVAESLGRKPTPDERQAAAEHLRRAEGEAARSRRIPEGVSGTEVASAGIVGFGTMGRGIAMSFAAAGIPVTVFEESDEAWARGEAAVAGSLSRSVGRGKIEAAEAERRMERIRRATGFGDLGRADFVVEAVFEEMAVKRDVFVRLDKVAKPEAVLATNTSSLDVNAIAAATGRPEAVVGTHFFSPAHVMRLLEVVVGEATSAATLATAMELGVRLGKAPVPVGVCDGFVGNRMLYAYRRQADRLLLEGGTPRAGGSQRSAGLRVPDGPLRGRRPGRTRHRPRGAGSAGPGGRIPGRAASPAERGGPSLRARLVGPEDRPGVLPLRARRPDPPPRSGGGRNRTSGVRRAGDRAPGGGDR